MLIFFLLSTIKLVGHRDPFFASSIEVKDPVDEINLYEMGFMFAVEKIDPSVGTIVAYRAIDDPIEGEIQDPVYFVDCDEIPVDDDGLKDLETSNYLCPIVDQDTLILQGHYKY